MAKRQAVKHSRAMMRSIKRHWDALATRKNNGPVVLEGILFAVGLAPTNHLATAVPPTRTMHTPVNLSDPTTPLRLRLLAYSWLGLGTL
jgi:hypothetical protein